METLEKMRSLNNMRPMKTEYLSAKDARLLAITNNANQALISIVISSILFDIENAASNGKMQLPFNVHLISPGSTFEEKELIKLKLLELGYKFVSHDTIISWE